MQKQGEKDERTENQQEEVLLCVHCGFGLLAGLHCVAVSETLRFILQRGPSTIVGGLYCCKLCKFMI